MAKPLSTTPMCFLALMLEPSPQHDGKPYRFNLLPGYLSRKVSHHLSRKWKFLLYNATSEMAFLSQILGWNPIHSTMVKPYRLNLLPRYLSQKVSHHLLHKWKFPLSHATSEMAFLSQILGWNPIHSTMAKSYRFNLLPGYQSRKVSHHLSHKRKFPLSHATSEMAFFSQILGWNPIHSTMAKFYRFNLLPGYQSRKVSHHLSHKRKFPLSHATSEMAFFSQILGWNPIHSTMAKFYRLKHLPRYLS